MSVQQLVQKFESLPLEMQKAVELFVDSLVNQIDRKSSFSSVEVQERYASLMNATRWAEEPDTAALFNLAKDHQLDLKEIRKNTWKR
jgi:hypothetical protein